MFSGRIQELLAPAQELLASSTFLQSRPLESSGARIAPVCALPRYIFRGPAGGGDAIRIGIFAGIHGDEPAGAQAAVRVLRLLEEAPALARGYSIFVYPVCNPTGFEDRTRVSRRGKDLNREFWCRSSEPEVALLEADILEQKFHGLISLHCDDTSEGVYGFVRGAVLTRDLLAPALIAASRILPLNTGAVIDGFPAHAGIISECYGGILTSPPDLDPAPFEMILETPQGAAEGLQVEAFLAAVESVLVEYQTFIAFAANL